MLEVRDARSSDSTDAAAVMVRSITQLCVDDHQGDTDRIERWTRNKTPEIVAEWIADPKLMMLVAVDGDRVVAVGGAMRPERIVLNYVDPSHRLCGASTQLLAELEARLRDAGADTLHLESTCTARDFYLSRGWREVGEAIDKHGMPGFRMVKRMTPA